MERDLTLIDILIEQTKEKEKYFKSYLKYSKIIKKEVEEILGQVKVYIFGSILRKNEIARDIDILIISPKIKKFRSKGEIIAKI